MTTVSAFDHKQIELPSGTVLEASLSVPLAGPEVQRTGNKLAVCLHPWSWLGGRMDDPVVGTLKRVFLENGYYVLCYNSRGVGSSSGWPSFTGLHEAKDLNELVEWALGIISSVKSIVVAGYSYGSLIASLFPLGPEDRKIRVSHILLSYPLGPRMLLTAFRGGHYPTTLQSLLRHPSSNVLIIYGDRDDFTSRANYDAWADGLRAITIGEGKGSLETVRVDGANHFWADSVSRDTLVAAIQSFIQ